ncbi:MAG: nucleotide exchange factor GrpE [Oscillospiraceae bacterium]|nr:nucleotide exchange factor GrpE [Oscillospiraceae bacterium]
MNDMGNAEITEDIEIENEDKIELENDDEKESEDDLKEEQKELKKLSEELAKKAEEYDILYDKYLRINAEYDNFRKRTAKEKEGIYSDAVIDVLNIILPVLDNVERAAQFLESSEPEKVSEGIKMIYSQFLNSFAKLGVEEIKSAGEQFNPEIHNAVFHEEDENQPNNTVTEALQKGYIKGDKVIRPAMVKVVN